MLRWLEKIFGTSQKFSVYVKLKVEYPVFFDEKKIFENIENYFKVYFKNNPLKKTSYEGIGISLFGGSTPFSEELRIQFVFDEHAKIFIDDQQEKIIRSDLSEITSIGIKNIKFDFLTLSELDENIGSAKSMLDKLNRLKNFNNELDE